MGEETPDQVENLRLAGNQYFQKKMYNNAVDCYSRALQMRLDPLVLGNRAQAYLNLKKYEKAYTDADAAIKLDPNFVKGIYRRALALHELGLNARAKLDLERILELEAQNKQAKELLEKIKHLPDPATIEVTTFTKCESLQSKIQLKNIHISSTSPEITEVKDGISELSEFDKIAQPGFLPSKEPISLPPPPKLAYDFMRAYVELKDFPENFAEYFLTIDHSLYNTLFGETMDADLIPLLICGFLKRKERSEKILNSLINLSMAQRFEINLLFLDNSTKQELCKLLNEFGSEFQTLVNSIMQLYDLNSC
uniref:RNA polymerase II-associated protein 3 n=1 Tax=Acrobeloides nanus TaxID=290746 RepID=A0A914E447_9BILA